MKNDLREGVSGEKHVMGAREQAEQTIQAANDEIAKVQAHYENEIGLLKRERLDVVHRIQELV